MTGKTNPQFMYKWSLQEYDRVPGIELFDHFVLFHLHHFISIICKQIIYLQNLHWHIRSRHCIPERYSNIVLHLVFFFGWFFVDHSWQYSPSTGEPLRWIVRRVGWAGQANGGSRTLRFSNIRLDPRKNYGRNRVNYGFQEVDTWNSPTGSLLMLMSPNCITCTTDMISCSSICSSYFWGWGSYVNFYHAGVRLLLDNLVLLLQRLLLNVLLVTVLQPL